MTSPTDALSVASAPMARTRSQSNGSAQEVKKSRRGSILSKVVKNGHGSPNLSPESLQPDSHKSKKDKKRRTKSTSSAGGNSIGAALAKGGLQLAGHAVDDTVSTKRPTNRSPYLVRGDAESSLKGGEGDDELSREESRLEYDSEEEETDSDLDDHLPVTGFAVASNRRNADFHALFPAVDPGDYLIDGERATEAVADGRLWLCPVKGHFGPRSIIRVGEPHLLPRKHLWLGHGRERCRAAFR